MKIFVTGISTDVGKTIASAIITEALEADYWKPIQAGDLENSDSHKIANLIANQKTKIHPNAFSLKTPASPHYAAEIDGILIRASAAEEPRTDNHMVIEGAGGILVPINDTETIADFIKPDYKVVVVSRHYLGSINHTLLTLEYLKQKDVKVAGIIFSGDENPATESILRSKTGVAVLGRIDHEPFFDKTVIADYAGQFRENLLALDKN